MYKRTKSKRTVSVKAFVAILALVLALGCAAGGTFAWLTAQTGTVTNTFTYGDINIELTETKPTGRNATIIPGMNIEKDPKVTVKANSEACWLFVMVEEEGTFVDNKVTYSIRDGWTKGTGANGNGVPENVYYHEVSADDAKAGVGYYVLAGDTTYPNGVITVSDTLTKDDIKTITAENQPKLKFTAYAVQRDGIDNVADAWAKTGA